MLIRRKLTSIRRKIKVHVWVWVSRSSLSQSRAHSSLTLDSFNMNSLNQLTSSASCRESAHLILTTVVKALTDRQMVSHNDDLGTTTTTTTSPIRRSRGMQVTGIWQPGWDTNAVEPGHTTYIGHLRVCEELRLPTVVGNWEKTRRRLADWEIGKLGD